MQRYRVVEIFESINGEGSKAGQLAVFLRFAGCALSCSYCDTAWANKSDVEVDELTAEEIVARVSIYRAHNLTVTGGEPLQQEGIYELLERLSQEEFTRIEVETNGAIELKRFLDLPPKIVFTMDYKLAGSGMESKMVLQNLNSVRAKDAVKFVVSSISDLLRAKQVCTQYALAKQTSVYLSPVFGKIAPSEIVDFMKRENWSEVYLQIQMHKVIWDSDKRGV